MTDTIIKGSGNSRTIKSVPNLAALAPTYDKLLELLIGQGLPVDIGALNPSGCVQIGNDLNKETLLKDTTAALYGKTAATPDEILAMISAWKSDIQDRCRVVTGTYTGTIEGDGSMRISTPFAPLVAVSVQDGYRWYIDGAQYPGNRYYGAIAVRGVASSALEISGNGFYAKTSKDGIYLSAKGIRYTYFALG